MPRNYRSVMSNVAGPFSSHSTSPAACIATGRSLYGTSSRPESSLSQPCSSTSAGSSLPSQHHPQPIQQRRPNTADAPSEVCRSQPLGGGPLQFQADSVGTAGAWKSAELAGEAVRQTETPASHEQRQQQQKRWQTSAAGASQLVRSHPQLTSKLQPPAGHVVLVEPPPYSAAVPLAVAADKNSSSVLSSPLRQNGPVGSNAVSSLSPPRPPPPTALHPWTLPAPLAQQRGTLPSGGNLSSLAINADLLCVGGSAGKRMIRLWPNQRRPKMVDHYRRIRCVDDMCRYIEMSDGDRMDLFPLGLEPSSDSDSDGGDVSKSTSTSSWQTELFLVKRLLTSCRQVGGADDDSAETMDEEESECSRRRQLYLLKKQLRLEKQRLLSEATVNMPIMVAAKRYPNSVGRALLHRAKKTVSKRRLRVLKQAIIGPSLPKKPPPTWANSVETSSLADGPRRCHSVEAVMGGTGRCAARALPYSNHCIAHVTKNGRQLLFDTCSLASCRNGGGIVDLGLEPWLSGSDRCALHMTTNQQTNSPSPTDGTTSLCESRRRQSARAASHTYPSQKRLKRRRPRSGGNRSDEPAQWSQQHVNAAGASEISLAREFGFADDREFSEILNRLPDETFENLIGPDIGGRDGPSGPVARLVESGQLEVAPTSSGQSTVTLSSTNAVDLGHSWADVEQFLLSEGYARRDGLHEHPAHLQQQHQQHWPPSRANVDRSS